MRIWSDCAGRKDLFAGVVMAPAYRAGRTRLICRQYWCSSHFGTYEKQQLLFADIFLLDRRA